MATWLDLQAEAMGFVNGSHCRLGNHSGRGSGWLHLHYICRSPASRERSTNMRALPPRDAGETLSTWLARVAPARYEEALRLRQRYRYGTPVQYIGTQRSPAASRALIAAA